MEDGRVRRRIWVYDCRYETGEQAKKILETSGLDFNGFLRLLHRKFAIGTHETFVLATTDRTVLDFDTFEELQDGCTLQLLQREDQDLAQATKEHINFTPHYDTLIKSGMYEYYASEGQTSLPYALAELIDNSLSATAKNTGLRTIEIRMMFDETLGKPAVIVLDNGCGMTSKQLSNWAVYRLSKFSRENTTFGSKEEGYVRPDPVPRSLNGDISYFGVGGKQACFYIGDSTRMISKPVGSLDVHELVLSKEDFKRKESNKEEIYSGTIINRKPGDSSHAKKDNFLCSLIAEESGKESFTAVVITGVLPEHIAFLKKDFQVWTRQLAHIYHYYIHGVEAKETSSGSTNSDHLLKIDIQITLREKPPKCPRALNLREVDTDMQTLYINAAVDTFEFQAQHNNGIVEGIIRYHPFLYDRETYPVEPDSLQDDDDDKEVDDDDYESGAAQQGRGARPIFDCFWNGRLIPYTKVTGFDWCTPNKGAKELEECYRRISGALFTDDRFEVSTNKLTFMNLELRLKEKDTIFTCVVNSQKRRGNMQKEFTQWLKNCHEKYDKQVKFLGYKETITRKDVPIKKMSPWATFSSIEWDGKTYKTGQLVKSQKTVPILYGSVVRFLLFGKHDRDVFAEGGEVEVTLEPKAFHDRVKTISISKIDKNATDETIKMYIDKDSAKLPETLNVDWSNGDPWPENATRPAGTPLGPLLVEILNKSGTSISTMPAVGQGVGKKLSVELKVVHHVRKRDQVLLRCVAQHSAKWGFGFTKIADKLTKLGTYTLSLQTMINDTSVFGGRQLPSYKLNFTIEVGVAESFTIGEVKPIHVGVPFDIPLMIKDGFDHSATPPPDLIPVLTCSGLNLSHETLDNSGTIRSVKARGKVLNYDKSKTYDLTVTLPGLKKDTQTVKVCLFPGNPDSLHVTPEDNPITVENGNPVTFGVEIHDEAGNLTAHPRQIVQCQVQGFPPATTDCSTTGAGQLVTKPINLKIIDGEPQLLSVTFDMPSQKQIALVTRELKVLPSTRIARMQLCRGDHNLVLRNGQKLDWLAGGLLGNLSYKLYDEAGKEVPPTAEIASMMKMNWTGNLNMEELARGMLPDIQVPRQVQDERLYQVSYQDQSVSFSFNIVPQPGEPTRLKATPQQITMKLGEIRPGNITLDLVDQYDNVVRTLTSTHMNYVKVEAEGLDKSAIVFKWQEGSVLITGVQFRSGTPGPREMHFTYSSYVERIIIKVTAGVPAHLKFVDGPVKPLQVLNGRGIDTPFHVQLCDSWGNPSVDQRVVVKVKTSPPTLKVKTTVTSQPVNAEGKASFTVSSVNGPKGDYQLEFTGALEQKPIPGPSVNVTIIPDPTKPVSLSVKFNTNAKLTAGGVFPDFSVTVVSDGGRPITKLNPADVSMLLFKGEPSGEQPPQMLAELKCSRPKANENNDCFHFRDKEIPEHAGKHTIQFSLRIDADNVLLGNQIAINVEADLPVKLGPDVQPPTPVVSDSEVIASRTLVENMTLRITDSYGNPAGRDLDGEVVVSIKNTSGNAKPNKILPLFEGKANILKIRLVEGKAHIARLAVKVKSPGENGSAYVLVFEPQVSKVPSPLAPFELQFHFYNDEENQLKMSQLSKEKDKLTADIDELKNNAATNKALLELMTNHHLTASRKEEDLRKELISNNVEVGPSAGMEDINRLLGEKNAEVDRILKAPRRVCSIKDQFRMRPDVLGMVGHLASVQDDDAARVISWHIRGDMDCVITKTTAAARRIYDDTRGSQQVMPLDSVYLQSDARSMPHIKNGHRLFDPPGNPVFAKDLLLYDHDPESCNTAFKNILGNTILIDDLDSANNYRVAVVQKNMPCPTILTRQGDRVSAKGKFGGAQNKAPPMNTLAVFGAPLPQHYHTLKTQIELLSAYQSALQKREQRVKERDDHLRQIRSPEMLKREQGIKEKEKELEEIERQLASSPVRPVKRRLESAGEPPSVIPKRAK